MSKLAEEYVFARLAMLEKEHDEHLKGTSAYNAPVSLDRRLTHKGL